MSKEIKPCPFCGGEAMISSLPASFNSLDRYYKVKCMSCGAETRKGMKKLEITMMWNRRVGDGKNQ